MGTRLVPVRQGKSVVYFSAGEHGEREKGKYAFWTAVVREKKGWVCIGRAPVRRAPGERFNRFEHERRDPRASQDVRDAYEKMWKMMGYVKLIRPSNKREIERWIASHMRDSIFIQKAMVDGKEMKLHVSLK